MYKIIDKLKLIFGRRKGMDAETLRCLTLLMENAKHDYLKRRKINQIRKERRVCN